MRCLGRGFVGDRWWSFHLTDQGIWGVVGGVVEGHRRPFGDLRVFLKGKQIAQPKGIPGNMEIGLTQGNQIDASAYPTCRQMDQRGLFG